MTADAYVALLAALREAGVSAIAFGPASPGELLPPPVSITFAPAKPSPAALGDDDTDGAGDAGDPDEHVLPDGIIDPRKRIQQIHKSDANRRGRSP